MKHNFMFANFSRNKLQSKYWNWFFTVLFWQCPQIKRRYGIKNKSALLCNVNLIVLNSFTLYYVYCCLIWGYYWYCCTIVWIAFILEVSYSDHIVNMLMLPWTLCNLSWIKANTNKKEEKTACYVLCYYCHSDLFNSYPTRNAQHKHSIYTQSW